MKQTFGFALTLCLLLGAGVAVGGDSPFDPNNSDYAQWKPVLVQDEISPSAATIDMVRAWVDAAFGRQDVSPKASDGTVAIVVERQDYSRLRINETCIGEAFNIQGGEFAKGLGTHGQSRLRLIFPEPVVSFAAKLGINKNLAAGSVRCAVEVGGKIVYQSDVVKKGEPAIDVNVKFEPAVSEFTLLVDVGDDGPSCDQANWLEPTATTADGKVYDIVDTCLISRFHTDVPFSFKYNGKSSREFLDSWTFSAKKIDAERDVYSWTDPETKLTVSATVRRFEKFAAADWVLNFKNEGSEDSGLIEDVLVLDAAFDYGFEHKDLALHTLNGDFCNEKSWFPIVEAIAPGQTREFAPAGGRPSNGTFPFWNLTSKQYLDSEQSEGVFFAIGWSGQWRASFENVDSAVSQTNVTAGMEKIATILYPNEEIRSPRILIMPWRSDRISAQVLFRRLLMFEYAPKVDGAPVKMEQIAQCFDRYYRKRPGWEMCSAQIESAKKLKEIGGSAYWFDAAWFPLGFPNGVGNWRSAPEFFPNGVEELGDALEQLGLRFILWFEPERVAADSDIANERPEYVFGGEKGGLYKLNDPEAREFLTNHLLDLIKKFKLGVYRNDFNLDPLPYWRDADEPNRQGMTEIRYVEGHYEMWNRFLSENPGLWIDNCASGGRRIDLETISISVPLWRSDTCCWPGHPEWDQTATLGLAQYLPLYSCSSWDSSPYTFRSAANAGAIMQYNFLDEDYDPVQAKASVDEAKAYQKFWYGDFYPLSPAAYGKGNIVAWQLNRSDLNAGLVYIFRQEESPYLGIEFDLRAIDPDKTYRVSVKSGYERDKTFEISGKELKSYRLMLEEKKSAYVIEYEVVK